MTKIDPAVTTDNNDADSPLVVFSVNELMKSMDEWRSECKDHANPKVTTSVQGQVYDFLRFGLGIVVDREGNSMMPSLTYDVTLDPKMKKRSVWYGIAYWMYRWQNPGEAEEFDAVDYASSLNKSIRSAVFNLQTTTTGRSPVLIATSHSVHSRDIEVVTFNGSYVLNSGKTAAVMSGDKDSLRWTATLKASLMRQNISEDDTQRIVASGTSLMGKMTATQIGNDQRKEIEDFNDRPTITG